MLSFLVLIGYKIEIYTSCYENSPFAAKGYTIYVWDDNVLLEQNIVIS